MTAGNNGAAGTSGTPEKDDPFAYLYRSEGGEEDSASSASSADPQPGVPRISYNQVRPVGSRQYPSAAQRQPAPHYAAPETLPGGAQGGGAPGAPVPPQQHAQHGGRGSGSGSNRRGLLIAAIAVVVVVAGGIGVAMLNNSGDDKRQSQNTANGSDKPSSEPSKKPDPGKSDQPSNPSAAGLQQRDAATLKLSGGAVTSKDVKGAKADGGIYITGMNNPGSAVDWNVEVPEAGKYTLYVNYGVPGTDASSTVTVNGQDNEKSLNMKNFSQAKNGDWERGWTHTYAYVTLNKGMNDIKISCGSGNQCNFILDQVSLKPGWNG
ncbi:CBM35 domain-containing protein [Streptomyces gamaensis]|uniref:CBM35 domain-containing protein n=1 Tax=Streptomyces gamaensis TaxID=1763542 RepID=A0ABW0Z137_9ACTN